LECPLAAITISESLGRRTPSNQNETGLRTEAGEMRKRENDNQYVGVEGQIVCAYALEPDHSDLKKRKKRKECPLCGSEDARLVGMQKFEFEYDTDAPNESIKPYVFPYMYIEGVTPGYWGYPICMGYHYWGLYSVWRCGKYRRNIWQFERYEENFAAIHGPQDNEEPWEAPKDTMIDGVFRVYHDQCDCTLVKYLGESETVVIPDTVTRIGGYVFYENKTMCRVLIPESVHEVEDSVFKGCHNLREVSLPRSLTTIGQDMFMYCPIADIAIPDGVMEIDSGAFDCCTDLKDIVIPDSVALLGNGAFRDCGLLENVVLPKSITEIPDYLFYSCYSLKKIVVPEGVTRIGDYAFSSAGLKEVVLPDGLTEIGDCAFKECRALEKINIPDSVRMIGFDAFEDCEKLPEDVWALLKNGHTKQSK
jgi:hypothetical protein